MREPREIEYSFLGCIFDNPPARITDALKVKANLEWFSDDTCRLVWAAIESLRKKSRIEVIKPLVIIDEAVRISGRKKSPFYGHKVSPAFIDEAKRFRDAAESDEKTTIEAYAPILRQAAIGRRLNTAMEAVKKEGEYTSNSDRLIALSKKIQQIQKDESPESGIDISDLLDNMTANYNKAYEEFAVKHNYNFIPGIPFPWDCISHMTKGLTPGLHIVAARPSVGKTSYVMQCINYWCELGYKVGVDCLDMSVTELIKRPVANYSYVSPKRMEFGWANPEEQYKVREAVNHIRDMSNAGILAWTVEYDVDKLKAWAEIRHRAGKLDILVIDFAQRFRLKNTTSEYEIATYASGVLKQLANECLIPVILLSQLSRDNVKDPNGKRPPELSDLRGSGALEQDATTVVLLHKVKDVIDAWRNEPPIYYVTPTQDPRLETERKSSIAAVCWNLAKNQNGETGEIPFVVFQNCFRWYVGDEDAEKAEMYKRIQADWRFLEEPFVTAAKCGAVVYPDFWPQKCAETCGKLGVEIPPTIREQLNKWDFDRYENLLKEHTERVEDAKEKGTQSITFVEPPPSLGDISLQPPHSVEKEEPDDSNKTIQHNGEGTVVNEELNQRLHDGNSKDGHSSKTDEPSIEDDFEDENF